MLKYIFPLILVASQLKAANPAEANTIGSVARERSDLTTFLKILEKSDLASSLTEQVSRSYTVFAPTDKAFNKLPDEALQTLFNPRNDDRLEEVFKFHVRYGSLAPIDLENYTLLEMFNGQLVNINYTDKQIGAAGLIGERIVCSNGVIYLIDEVLSPNTDDLFQALQKDGRFKIFTKAITASRQGKSFQNTHFKYTTFAPTDEAFNKLPKRMLESLFKPENDERLEDIIKHHISNGLFARGKIPGYISLGRAGNTPKSLYGQSLNFSSNNGKLTIDGANISETDIPTANGIIHVIDSVIPPSELSVLEILESDPKFKTTVSLIKLTGLDLPTASSTFTVFAPTDDAWAKSIYSKIVKKPKMELREKYYALLARHVITGAHVTENSLLFQKLRTIHGAPIYLTRDGELRKINGRKIIQSDFEAFNGFVNAIDGVIADQMELPEGDVSILDAISFVEDTLKHATELYDKGEYEECWKYYAKKGLEFIAKYEDRGYITSAQLKTLRSITVDDQPSQQFATEAWTSRNAFRTVLRQLQNLEENIVDSKLMMNPEAKRFGR